MVKMKFIYLILISIGIISIGCIQNTSNGLNSQNPTNIQPSQYKLSLSKNDFCNNIVVVTKNHKTNLVINSTFVFNSGLSTGIENNEFYINNESDVLIGNTIGSCENGSKPGQNVNWLYCSPYSIEFTKKIVSNDGIVLEIEKYTFGTIVVDQNKTLITCTLHSIIDK